MAIGTHEKISVLIRNNKADSSIDNEYSTIERECKELKKAYKQSRIEFKIAEEKLDISREGYKNANSFFDIIKVRGKEREAKKEMKLKKEMRLLAKTKYKQKLADLRLLRREIRGQYKVFNEYQIFFKRVQKAQNLGIQLPKYILDEYKRVDALYSSEKYQIYKSGERRFLTEIDTSISKDVFALISEHERNNVKEVIQNTITNIKDLFEGR